MNEKLPLTSLDVHLDRVDQLRRLFPEFISENIIDPEKLQQALGLQEAQGREAYGLSWAGKADAIKNMKTLSTGTLKPFPAESVEFDRAANLIIEGDNLEVLKLLQQHYYGKVKMIYIDPPYNTGNEFIYPDNFREGLEEYLRYSGQVNGEGMRLTTNTEADGRFHSKWLSMMYPRLFLARNLLREDGIMFVSIDDHEVHNLRLLMDEIFGSENFIATVIWQKVYSPKNTARHFSEDHDYIVVYARDAQKWAPQLLPRTEEMEARYTNPDHDPRGPWASSDLCARNYYGEGTYSVRCPAGRVIAGPPSGSYWRVSKAKLTELDSEGRIYWGADGNNMPRLKRYLSEVKAGLVPQTLWKYSDVGHTQDAKRELLSRVAFASSDSVFDTPKPTRLIERMLRLATTASGNDVILDFFAGSGTTGEAVMKLNMEDGGNRRFILVQLPEPTGYTDYATIADITKERIRQSIKVLSSAGEPQLRLDIVAGPSFGFKLFKLAASNFKIWDVEKAALDADGLSQQLRFFADHIKPGSAPFDVLYEVLLKAGMDLNPQRVVCLDPAFGGNDQLKTNTVLEMKSHGISFRTV